MTDLFDPAGGGVRHSALRAANRRAVLATITFNPGISNADISRRTGLAPQTASGIVSDLEAEGLVQRGEVLRGRRGQPATPLFLNFDRGYAIGCDIGWQHLDMMLINLGSRTLSRYRRDYQFPDARTIVKEVADVTADMLDELTPVQRRQFVGIGIGTPAYISRNLHIVDAEPGQKERWDKLDLAKEIEAATGMPTRRYNDANCAVWAELAMTPAPRPRYFAYIYIGSFVGGGVVFDHDVWVGPTGTSANLGSIIVSAPDGEPTFAHFVASIDALRKRLAADGVAWPGGCPQQLPWDDWEEHVAPWVEAAGVALAQMVINISAVTEFKLAIIDGDLPRSIVERLVTATERASLSLPQLSSGTPRILPGRLGGDAIPLGAAQMPMLRAFYDNSDLKELTV